MKIKFVYFVLFCFLATSPSAQTLPLMQDFIGVNIKGQTHWEKADHFSNVRDLHSWAEDFPTPGGGRLSFRVPYLSGQITLESLLQHEQVY
jgi:hypothetical protein